MTFILNQIFDNTYPPEAAQFCNQHGYVIKEIEKRGDIRRFQIQELPAPTPEELAQQRKNELLAALDRLDAASARALRAIIAAQTAGKEPDAADVERLRAIEAEAQTWRLELARLQ